MYLSLDDYLETKSEKYGIDLVSLRDNPRYGEYSAPRHISSFAKKFDGINFNTCQNILNDLTLFYFWMKRVDDEIDSGVTNGKVFLKRFTDRNFNAYESNLDFSIKFTDALRDLTFPLPKFEQRLGALYQSVLTESEVQSMPNLIEARIESGILISNLSSQIISLSYNPSLQFKSFLDFLGEFGNLFDSAEDLDEDITDKVINFTPDLFDRLNLKLKVGKLAVQGLMNYPFLIKPGLDYVGKKFLQ